MPDFEQELIARLRRGTSAAPVEVTPGPADDPEAALIARLRADALTSKITTPSTKENPRGQVLDTPGWGMGAATLNGMLQGYLPQLYAGAAARPFVQTNETERQRAKADYEKKLADITFAKKNYGEENPGKALVGEIGGSASTLIPAMAAGAGAIAPIGAGIARAAPWAAGLVDFLSGAGSGAMRLPSLATRGAVEGAGAAAGSSGLSDKPLGEQMKTGAGIGALVNPVVGGIAAKLGSHVNATTAETAQALLDQGVAIRAGDIPGSNKAAQVLNKVFGGGTAQQREQFGEKLTGYAGLPEKEVSQGWVAKNDARVGKVMNDIQSVYSIPAMESGLVNDLAGVRKHAIDNFSVDNAVKVNGFVNKIEENLYSPLNGAVYKNLTQKGGLLDNMSKDKDIATAVPKLREALDDAWGRALPADKKAAWDEARRHYKVTRVIDDSMGASGAAEGVYNPKKLLKAVEDRFGNVENAGDLGMLARGGQFLEAPGAAPASAKHGTAKMVGNMALGGAAAVAASEGSKVITHMGPEAIAALTQHPESFALPLLLAAGLYGGAKMGNAALNGPRATQYLLDVSRGSRNPLLIGNNPMLPMLVEGYNRQ